ncbi:hypothetical protein PTSG_02086 [Salpingoeca rosetta]|uniref:ENTH domain-containing protein n=1 Tax=Salpingoeca rosetta (strain ATCC 50818 / BSB-021) TaxID=946362 RepID=F2U2L2_SALR5|nr:uncharacterized protein PTSG_02086 [Salpingoeca rosetta]EGD81367.1 hypothetical protein PTSG_02086 [Salpingoeca rosetta]|eukprot:XP_004996571.1 hypothetical protein PTSG_02086 [Salpingoeca rosetta]
MDSIKRNFALRSQLMMLNRATSDKPDPTPGYMFTDIAKLTFESSQMSMDLMDYLLARVKKKSVYTKIKALKILKYLVEKGHEGFFKDLQRRSDDIRQAMEFKGAVDPLHGDTFNKQVREHASKLMEALFNPKSTGPRAPPDASKTSIAKDAFGSSGASFSKPPSRPASQAMSSTSSSTSNLGQYYYTETTSASGMKMWGMGSGPAKSESFVDKMKARVSQAKDRVVTALNDKNEEPAGYTPMHNNAHSEMARAFRTTGTPSTSSGRVGGLQRPGGSYRAPQEPATGPEHSSISTDPDYIDRVVQTITAPGGVKVAPPQQDLDAFVSKCRTLDGHQVADALLDRIDAAATDRETLRILHVVKALAGSDIIGIEACLAPIRDPLEDYVAGDHAGIKKKAREIIRILDQKEQSYLSSSKAGATDQQQQSQQSKPAAAPTNLLDLDEPAPASGGLEELLGGQQRQQQSEQTTPTSLFSGMSLGGATTATTAAAPAVTTAPQQQSSGSLLDMGDDTTSTTTTTTTTGGSTGGSSLFSGMALATGDQQQQQQQAVGETVKQEVNGNQGSGSLLDLGDVFLGSNNAGNAPTPQQSHQPSAFASLLGNSTQQPQQQQTQQQQQPSQSGFDLSSLYSQQQTPQQQMPGMMMQPSMQQQMQMQQMMMMQQQQQQQQQQQRMQMPMQGGGMMMPAMMAAQPPTTAAAAQNGRTNTSTPPKTKKADAFDFVAQELAKSRK